MPDSRMPALRPRWLLSKSDHRSHCAARLLVVSGERWFYLS
jgi:hypothetical protein